MYLSPLRNLLQSFLFASNSLSLFFAPAHQLCVFLVIPSLDATRMTLPNLQTFSSDSPSAAGPCSLSILSPVPPSSASPPNGRSPRAAEGEEPPSSSVASAGAAALSSDGEERGGRRRILFRRRQPGDEVGFDNPYVESMPLLQSVLTRVYVSSRVNYSPIPNQWKFRG